MFGDAEAAFVAASRVAHLATADAEGVPHVVPICFAVSGHTLYMAIDQKPKRRQDRPLRRLRNIAENPAVCVVVDRYDEDWGRLGWVMMQGHADILVEGGSGGAGGSSEAGGDEHARAQAMLKVRYPQLAAMEIGDLPVVAVRIRRVTSWGRLSLP